MWLSGRMPLPITDSVGRRRCLARRFRTLHTGLVRSLSAPKQNLAMISTEITVPLFCWPHLDATKISRRPDQDTQQEAQTPLAPLESPTASENARCGLCAPSRRKHTHPIGSQGREEGVSLLPIGYATVDPSRSLSEPVKFWCFLCRQSSRPFRPNL